MDIASFADIEQEFIERAHKMVWCNVATVDMHNHPRSRVLHPIWEGATGWIATGRNTFKATHLAHNPYVSLAYIGDPLNPVYVDATAEWEDDLAQKQRIWELFKQTATPLGYDPAPFFERHDHPQFGLLKITPRRIQLYTLSPHSSRIWRAKP